MPKKVLKEVLELTKELNHKEMKFQAAIQLYPTFITSVNSRDCTAAATYVCKKVDQIFDHFYKEDDE